MNFYRITIFYSDKDLDKQLYLTGYNHLFTNMDTKMTAFINTLEIEFAHHANPKIALEQKAYMRNQFEFYGIKATERREIQKPFFKKEFLPKKEELDNLVKSLWEKPQRDYQYFSQELAFKYVNQLEKKDIDLFEYMVTHKFWWSHE